RYPASSTSNLSPCFIRTSLVLGKTTIRSPMVVSARIESISIVKTRESSKAWGGEGWACNGRLGSIGPLTTTFESDFLCRFWLGALAALDCLLIFFETFFDLALLLRVFFLVMILTRVACGVGRPSRLLLICDPEY